MCTILTPEPSVIDGLPKASHKNCEVARGGGGGVSEQDHYRWKPHAPVHARHVESNATWGHADRSRKRMARQPLPSQCRPRSRIFSQLFTFSVSSCLQPLPAVAPSAPAIQLPTP